MFVRFRTARSRLQVSLIETRRIEGKVRHEHVAGLGTIEMPLTVDGRIEFWRRLHERLGRLANRFDTAALGKVVDEVHARIPMVTAEEIRAHQLENTEAEEHFWQHLAEMQTELAASNDHLAASAQQTATEAKAQAEYASGNAAAARDRGERLKRGEAVAGGLRKPMDMEQTMRAAGMTAASIRRALQTHMISELGGKAGFKELLDEMEKRKRAAENAAKRAVLKRQIRQALAEGRAKIDGDRRQLLYRRPPETA